MSLPSVRLPDSQTVPEDVTLPDSDLWSDEPPLESDKHREQIDALIRLIKWWWRNRDDFYAAGNLTIYYSPNQKTSEYFRGPDFFVVLGTEKKDRRSWVVWHEGGKYPNVIIELLSDSTASVDKGFKKELYQDTWRVPDYFWFSPDTLEFQGFSLLGGQYQAITPTVQGWLWSQQLGLYLGIHKQQLRFFTPKSQLVPFPEESAEQRAESAEQEAEQARQRAEQAEQSIATAASRLLEMGLSLEQVAETLGLSVEQVFSLSDAAASQTNTL